MSSVRVTCVPFSGNSIPCKFRSCLPVPAAGDNPKYREIAFASPIVRRYFPPSGCFGRCEIVTFGTTIDTVSLICIVVLPRHHVKRLVDGAVFVALIVGGRKTKKKEGVGINDD